MPNPNSAEKALFIDTASEPAQVVLIVDGEIADNVVWPIGFAAGKEVLEKINELLSENNVSLNEIQRIAVHSGPGKRSSTLRSGITVATFLAFAHTAKLVVVKENNKDKLVDAIFTASPLAVVQPDYDRPGIS